MISHGLSLQLSFIVVMMVVVMMMMMMMIGIRIIID
jgi:hypothetical protein